jgi:hypothetical protein
MPRAAHTASLTLELGRVELNSDNEARRNSTPDFYCDFKGYTRAILEAAPILIVALVGRSGEELRKHTTVATIQLDAIKANFV